ncbi:MAG: hypothetical protein IPJ85_13595 [Flavobacteriales bacterium]|nr:hypothetical protein [Flavobacteriales bacterium]
MTAPVVLKARAGEEVAVLDVSQDTLELLGIMSHWYRVALRGTEVGPGAATSRNAASAVMPTPA